MGEFDYSRFTVARLNAETFPVTRFEQERYDEFGISPTLLEASGDEIIARVGDCHALFVVAESLPATVINALHRCRVISRIGAGTDKLDRRAATQNGIVITNVPDFCVEEQADHAMAMLLALIRKLPEMHDAMIAGRWSAARSNCRSIRRLDNQTLGLVGFGGSAKALARRARGFGLRVIATRRRQHLEDSETAALGVELTDLDTVLRESDFVSLHLPLTDETHHLLNRRRLFEMKQGAILINTARGAIVDESALAEALTTQHLSAAGLDTFHEINVHGAEARPEHALMECPNVLLSPHVAAFSVDSSRDVSYGAVDNVACILRGLWPRADRVVNGDVTPRQPLLDDRDTSESGGG